MAIIDYVMCEGCGSEGLSLIRVENIHDKFDQLGTLDCPQQLKENVYVYRCDDCGCHARRNLPIQKRRWEDVFKNS